MTALEVIQRLAESPNLAVYRNMLLQAKADILCKDAKIERLEKEVERLENNEKDT